MDKTIRVTSNLVNVLYSIDAMVLLKEENIWGLLTWIHS